MDDEEEEEEPWFGGFFGSPVCVRERDDDDTEEEVSCYAPLHKRPSPSFFINRDKTFPQTKTSLEKTCCKLGRTK